MTPALTALLLAFPAATGAPAPLEPDGRRIEALVHVAAAELDWHFDLEEARREAEDSGRPLVVYQREISGFERRAAARLRIDLPEDPRALKDADAIRALFEQEYVAQYGLKLDQMRIELVNWRVAASGPNPERRSSDGTVAGADASRGHRTVYLRGEPTRVPVFARSGLADDVEIPGPVIVEERETTVFVLPGWTLTKHETGSLVATRQSASNSKEA